MSFDWQCAIGRSLRPAYLPPTMPPPFQNPIEMGWTVNFASAEDFDPQRTTNTHVFVPAQRYITPSRSRGHDIYDSSSAPAAGVGGWELVQHLGANASNFYHQDTDVAINGWAFRLQTGANNGAVAGLRRTLPTVPAERFSMMLMTRTHVLPPATELSPHQVDGLNIWLTNVEGYTLAIRFYKLKTEMLFADFYDPDGDYSMKWRMVTNHVQDFFWEIWPEAEKVEPGVFNISARAGTTLIKSAIGQLPLNLGGLGPNKLYMHQQSAAWNYRCGDLRTFNVGTSQNADDCTICSMPKLMPSQVVEAQLAIVLGETSGDLLIGQPSCRLNQAFRAYVSSTNGDHWTPVPLQVEGQVGWDVIDPTKPAYLLTGRVPLNQVGNCMRWAIEFKDEYFGTLQGVQMLGFAHG